jgi:hypothetical protein
MSPIPSGEDSTVLISFLALGNYSSFSSNITLLYLVEEALILGFYSNLFSSFLVFLLLSKLLSSFEIEVTL